MKKEIFKSIAIGIFIGAFQFFTGPLIFIVLLLKFIFTPFGMFRMGRFGGYGRHGMWGGPKFAFADKIRSMSEEEYSEFKSKFGNRNHSHCYQQK